MIRAAVGAALFLVAPSSPAAAPTASATRLAIAVYPQGTASTEVRGYTLSCAPARGTVPRPIRACRELARLRAPFAPVPPRTVCAQIDLGPQEALVRGRLDGRPVNVHLTLRGSCEIERWRRVSLVVPGFPASG